MVGASPWWCRQDFFEVMQVIMLMLFPCPLVQFVSSKFVSSMDITRSLSNSGKIGSSRQDLNLGCPIHHFCTLTTPLTPPHNKMLLSL